MRTYTLTRGLATAATAAALAVGVLVAAGQGIAAEAEKKPDTPLPQVGQELSTVEGVSLVRIQDDVTSWSVEISKKLIRIRGWGLLRSIVRARVPGLTVFVDAAPLPGGKYDISATADPKTGDAWKRLAEAYEKAFKVRIHEDTREVDAHVVTCGPVRPRGLKPGNPKENWSFTVQADGIDFTNVAMDRLAAILRERFGALILDETKLKGVYTFKVPCQNGSLEGLIEGLKGLGLGMKQVRRPVKAMFIDKA